MAGPLVTRSLPDAPWGRIDPTYIEWDIRLQAWAESQVSPSHPLTQAFVFFTERNLGLALLGMFFLGIFLWARRIRGLTLLPRPVTLRIALLAPLLVLSDWTATQLKEFVGRLKPHVDFYNPNFLPALSLPSNHAVNTTVLVLMIFFLQKPQTLKSWSGLNGLLLFWGITVVLSRVFLGQHYPLDIAAGCLVGILYAATVGQLALRLARFDRL